jgi:hypothetical protein
VADEGIWFLGDTVSSFPECGKTPHSAEIITIDGSRALKLVSNNSDSGCADNIWVELSDFSLVGPFDTNKGFSVPLERDTIISFKEKGKLTDPQIHSRGGNCFWPPCFDNVSLQLGDNSGNFLVYVLQRVPDREPNTRISGYENIYREIFLDPNAGTYSRNLFEDFSKIPGFNPKNVRIMSIVLLLNKHGWATIDDIKIGKGAATPVPELTSNAETIFDWAEDNHPQFFPPPGASTQFFDPWLFRYYPSTDIYAGVNTSGEVWVLGDVFGGLVYISTVEELLATIPPAPPPTDGGNDRPNFTGTWRITEQVDARSCDEGFYMNRYIATVVVNGNQVALTFKGVTISGILNGNTATFSNASYPDGEGITTITGTLAINGNTLSGNFNWSWTDNYFSCSGQTTVSGERI